MFFSLVQNVILDVCLTRPICYLPKGKFVCFACQVADNVGEAKHIQTQQLSNSTSIALSREGACTPLPMAAISVAPISRRTPRFSVRYWLADVEVTRYFPVKMIIRVREGQTNKHDTLIADRDDFVLSMHHRLSSRYVLGGARETRTAAA
jgi:hypothetical protein